MKLIKSTILSLSLLTIAPVHAEEEVFELNVGENSGSSIFGIEFDPEVHLNLTGLLESDTPVSDLATNEHDPSRDYQIHPVELHSNFGFTDQLKGGIDIIALETPSKDWEIELEQVKLTYEINDSLVVKPGFAYALPATDAGSFENDDVGFYLLDQNVYGIEATFKF